MTQSNNDKKALKSGIWYILCNFIVKGAAFITTPIFTRLMSQDDVGAFSNVTAWANILIVITSLELASSVTFAKFEYGDKLDEFISSVLGLSTVVSVVCYGIVLAFHGFFQNLFGFDMLSLNLVFLYFIFSPALQMIQVKNRVLFQYKSSTVLSLLSVLLSVLASLALVLCMKNNRLAGRVIGYYGALILFNLGIYIYLMVKGRHVSPGYWKFALTISIPMIIHVLSGHLLSSCDRIMITRICGSAKNALYSIAYSVATVISVLWTSLNTAWSPWAYEQMDNKAYHRLKYASKPYIVMFFIVVVGFVLPAPEIMLVMGGKKYQEAVAVIPPVVIGMFFQFVYSLYVNIEFFHKKQKFTAVGTGIAALLNVVLNWLLIPRFGYVAAAYTTLVGYVTLFLIHFGIVRHMKKTWWYDTRFNFTILLISLMVIPVASVLYKHFLLRWIVIGLIALCVMILAFRHREALKQALKKKSLKPVMAIFAKEN